MARPRAVIHSSFEKFKQSVSADDAKRIESTELQDVWAAVRQVDNDQRLQTTQALARMEPLLKEIGKYSSISDIFNDGTPYMAYVWAPIKFNLQLASERKDVIEALISAYADIGAALPSFESNFDGYRTAFDDIKELKYAFGAIYSGILDFHRITWKIFRRVHWRQLFYTLWKDSMPKIESTINSLKQQGDLIDRRRLATSSSIQLGGTNDQDVEERRSHQHRVRDNAVANPVESRPLTTFETLETGVDIGARTLRRKCVACFAVYLLWVAVAVGSLVLGLWRSFATGDEGKGFTDAAYVVAVGGIVVFPIQSRHGQRCRASRQVGD
ncbi:hypothetical protein DL98DRAFT_566332 [Cadophora sp. DSE1049]|nr:hypothetical protein DL98DRAFT_566332 [Cadophora sp. DSE1049]